MRLTVNLGMFFHDHRSLAKIFINNKMNIIRDVENRIAEIFNIDNFYLKSENVFLPPTEDVKILNNDDVVWAVPIGGTPMGKSAQFEQQKVAKSKKLPPATSPAKDSKQISSDGIKAEDTSPVDKTKKVASLVHTFESRTLPYTKQLNVVNPINSLDERRINIVKTIIISNKKPSPDLVKEQNGPRNENEVPAYDSLSTLDVSGSTGSSSTSEVGAKIGESKNESLSDELIPEKEIIPDVKLNGNKNHYDQNELKRSVQSPAHFVVNARILAPDEQTLETEDLPGISRTINGVSPKRDEVNGALIAVPEQSNKSTNDVVTILELGGYDSSSNVEVGGSTCNSTISEIGSKSAKRKRKRTRRRKHAEPCKDFSIQVQEEFQHSFREPPLQKTPTHVRFENQSTPSKEYVTTEVDLNDSEDCQELEVMNTHDSEQAKKPDVLEDLESSYTYKEIESCILKQPITDNTEPKIGDVIAFKMLKISDNYTPEVSSTIVGKVVDYKTANKEITFNVVYGRDQWESPRGKFALDPDEEPVAHNSQVQCLWGNLLEPRLLFP